MTLFLYYAQIKITNYQGLNEVLRTRHDPVEIDFMPDYLDANLWSTTYHVHVSIINQDNDPDDATSEPLVCYQMMEQTHVFDANLQKELLSEYE